MSAPQKVTLSCGLPGCLFNILMVLAIIYALKMVFA